MQFKRGYRYPGASELKMSPAGAMDRPGRRLPRKRIPARMGGHGNWMTTTEADGAETAWGVARGVRPRRGL